MFKEILLEKERNPLYSLKMIKPDGDEYNLYIYEDTVTYPTMNQKEIVPDMDITINDGKIAFAPQNFSHYLKKGYDVKKTITDIAKSAKNEKDLKNKLNKAFDKLTFK